jgi:hypothetical protein
MELLLEAIADLNKMIAEAPKSANANTLGPIVEKLMLVEDELRSPAPMKQPPKVEAGSSKSP